MLTEGASDEVVTLAAVLGDARLAKEYVERAVQHVRKVSVPDKADRNERAVRALEALAAGRFAERSPNRPPSTSPAADAPRKANSMSCEPWTETPNLSMA